jgi:ankyrin repeat protein
MILFVVSGSPGIVKLLLDRGANINDKSNDGTAALKLADNNGKTGA